MKKAISMLVVIVLLLGIISTTVNAQDIFQIKINGKDLVIPADMGYPYINTDGRVMIPMRVLLEAMGFTVDYENKTKKITIPMAGGKKVVLQLYSNKVQTPNGEITMDTKAVSINGRTYVPIRFVAEALDWKVGYKQLTDNSGASNGKATHMVTVDKDTTGNTTPVEENGIMINGVRKYEYGKIDMRKNEYLVNFMKNNYAENTYWISKMGIVYGPFGHIIYREVSGATIFVMGDVNNKGYWTIEVDNFDTRKERPILLATLKSITGDADAVYSKFVEMWDGSATVDEAVKKYNYGTWKTVGKTTYMFDTDNSKTVYLKIKY